MRRAIDINPIINSPFDEPTRHFRFSNEGITAGKTFVLAGGLEGFTRGEAKDLIVQAGGRVTSLVSKQTDYVVVSKDPGSKHDDAKRLGVPTIDEAASRKLMAVPR